MFLTTLFSLSSSTSISVKLPSSGSSRQSSADLIDGIDDWGTGLLLRVCSQFSQICDCSRNVTVVSVAFAKCSFVLIPCLASHSLPRRSASDLFFFSFPTAKQIG